MRDQAIRAGGEDPGKPLHFVTGETVGRRLTRRRGHVALRRQVVQNGADVVRLETEGRLYLHGSGEPEASEGDTADVTLFRADEHGTRFRSTAGVHLAREGRKVLTTGDSVVLPDGGVVLPFGADADLSPLGREVDSLRIGGPPAQSIVGRGTRAFGEVWKRFLTG